jgi:translation initiation factor 1
MGLFAGTPFDVPAHCDKCGELESACTCPAPPPFRIPPEKQTARLATEKRKRGKVVTVIQGLPAVGNDLPDLLTRLKTACGAGGTLKDDVIEIQGEHLPRIREVLQSLGFRVKG